MTTVTQKARYRQAIIQYADKYGITKAANRYNVNRQYIYRWKKRYDGTLQSLADKSHRPHYHPNQHTKDEVKADFGYAPQKPTRWIGDLLGQAPSARLLQIYYGIIPDSSQTRKYGG